jgi:transposase, IS30 family
VVKLLGHTPSTITIEFKRNTCRMSTPVGQPISVANNCALMDVRQLSSTLTPFCMALCAISCLGTGHLNKLRCSLLRLAARAIRIAYQQDTIYNCIYAQPVGELRRELIACLRQAKTKRAPRNKGQDKRGQIPNMVSIHLRPPEIEDR